MIDNPTGCDVAHDEGISVSDSMMIEVLGAFSMTATADDIRMDEMTDAGNAGESL